MKRILSGIFMMLSLVLFSSCLESNLDALPVFSDADISAVRYADFRYENSETVDNVTTTTVKYTTLTVTSSNVDGNVVSCVLTVPDAVGTFTTAVRNTVSLTNISLGVTTSSAAVITPMNGAPAFGQPGDWSKPNKYLVKAADGTQKEWTIQVTKLIK
jgi:hypothetical protein